MGELSVHASLARALERLYQDETGANPGLVYERYVDARLSDNKDGYLQRFLKLYMRQQETGHLLQEHLNRRRELVARVSGCLLRARTAWRLVSGLGNGHPLETGFVWHRILGVPFLPGSSVKGMLRAWVDQDKGWGGMKFERVCELFGDLDSVGMGRLIVMDALPTGKTALEMDIMNPHYQPYYQDPMQKPPADYYAPIPVCFLTIAPEQEFEFALLPGRDCTREDLDDGLKLLGEALEVIGLGGKTASGYGGFAVIGTEWPSVNFVLPGRAPLVGIP